MKVSYGTVLVADNFYPAHCLQPYPVKWDAGAYSKTFAHLLHLMVTLSLEDVYDTRE